MKPVKNKQVSIVKGGHYWTKKVCETRMIKNCEVVIDEIRKRGDKVVIDYHYPHIQDYFTRDYDEFMTAIKQ